MLRSKETRNTAILGIIAIAVITMWEFWPAPETDNYDRRADDERLIVSLLPDDYVRQLSGIPDTTMIQIWLPRDSASAAEAMEKSKRLGRAPDPRTLSGVVWVGQVGRIKALLSRRDGKSHVQQKLSSEGILP